MRHLEASPEAHPAAEAAKAAAEEAMAEEDRRAEAEAPELVPSSSDVNPPEHLPPALEAPCAFASGRLNSAFWAQLDQGR